MTWSAQDDTTELAWQLIGSYDIMKHVNQLMLDIIAHTSRGTRRVTAERYLLAAG